jgi:hypothetical protein
MILAFAWQYAAKPALAGLFFGLGQFLIYYLVEYSSFRPTILRLQTLLYKATSRSS